MTNKIHWLVQATNTKISSDELSKYILENKLPFTGIGLIPYSNTVTNLSNAYKAYLENPSIVFVARGGTNIIEKFQNSRLVKMNVIRELNFSKIPYTDLEIDGFVQKVSSSVFYHPENFKQNYQKDLNLPFLNNDAEIFSLKNSLDKSFSEPKFIKPNDDEKSFRSGILQPKQTIHDFIRDGYFKATYQGSEALISTPKDIQSEYRFVVANGKIIAGSQYFEKNKSKKQTIDISQHTPLIEAANNYAQLFSPSEIFTMDICETQKNEFKIVEYNCFNCSVLYECNIENLVNGINLALNSKKSKPTL